MKGKYLVKVACIAIAAGLVLAAADAQAWNKGEMKCRATISKGLGKYVATAQKTLAGCHKNRNKGKVGAATQCNQIAVADMSKKKVQSAASKFRASVSGGKSKCRDKKSGFWYFAVLANFGRCPSPAQTTDDGGATDGIDDFDELADCLLALADQIVQSTATEIIGLPDVGALGKAQLKCHGTLPKAYMKYIATVAKERGKAQAGQDKGGSSAVWDQGSYDGKGKIGKALAKLNSSIDKACTRSKAELDALGSCADSAADLKSCVGQIASTVGAGLVAMQWELPGVCPTGAPVTFNAGLGAQLTNAELDTGWKGTAHDVDIIDGFQSAVALDCNSDCDSCTVTTDPSPGYCRCANDVTQECDDVFGPDTDDCNGGLCRCFFGPPLALSSSGTPVCIVNEIVEELVCNCDGGTGICNGDCDVSLAAIVHLGVSQTQPCPSCTAGTCDGGTRDGQACSVTAAHPTFGPASLDCPPASNQNISGTGLAISLGLTHGNASLPRAVPCGLVPGMQCACAVCTGDSTLPCNSDAECGTAGSCTSMGGGASSLINECTDGLCEADPGADGEGRCTVGPTDSYCDGQLRASGEGFLPCTTDADCEAIDEICDGGDCGNCTVTKRRNCFLDPITASGDGNRFGGDMASTFCVPPTISAAVNSAGGIPGPGRVTINFDYYGVCADGTAHQPPGGSNCQ